jgi:hypothetical protein
MAAVLVPHETPFFSMLVIAAIAEKTQTAQGTLMTHRSHLVFLERQKIHAREMRLSLPNLMPLPGSVCRGDAMSDSLAYVWV